jgi:acetyl esterase/lipase
MNPLKITVFLLGLFGLGLATGCQRDPEPDDRLTPEGRYREDVFSAVNVSSGLAYGSAVDNSGHMQTLLLDLYEPAGDTVSRRAAIVWIQGGGFVSGSRTTAQMAELATRFAKKGYLAVSIDYRLATPAQFNLDPWPAMRDAMFDAKAAVRWLRANSDRYRIDAARVAVGGGSAGAFTALHTAYLEEEGDSGNPGFSSQVGAVVDFWGGMQDVSEMEGGEAPLIIIHGTLDATVPFALAQQLVARAQSVGVPYEFHPLEGSGHSAWQFMEQFIAWITPFLYQYLISES